MCGCVGGWWARLGPGSTIDVEMMGMTITLELGSINDRSANLMAIMTVCEPFLKIQGKRGRGALPLFAHLYTKDKIILPTGDV